VCKIWTKNSQPFGKKCQKTSGGSFLTHTVHCVTESKHIYIPPFVTSESEAHIMTGTMIDLSGVSIQRNARNARNANRKLKPIGTELFSFQLNSLFRFKI